MRPARTTSDRWRDDGSDPPSSAGSFKYHGRHPFDMQRRRRNILLGVSISFLACLALYFSRSSDRTSLRPRSPQRTEGADSGQTTKSDEDAIDATQASRESTEATDRAARAAADLVDTLDAARDAADQLRRVAAAAAHKKRVADRAMAAAAAMQMKQNKGDKRNGGDTEIASMRERKVKLKDGTEASFSIFGRSENDVSVFVLPFNTKTKHFTLVEEFHPGPNRHMIGLVAGMFEPKHGGSAEKAAIWELSEEARLKLGDESKLISLAPDAKGGFSQDKYSSAHFLPFLALDCVEDTRPRPQDREENIQVHHDISVDDLRKMIKAGKLNMASTSFAMMGINYLEASGMLE